MKNKKGLNVKLQIALYQFQPKQSLILLNRL